ncbi:hypothetical protein NDU88_001854 [Pleurodeles waltl]|uniref:Uncharacterized protein n=1 Tax=Pleurodeles waltl TaxID=8319 RepID=A0AAV7T1P8_PLEWA|nr:hypothetical protein NDU88_001854 [Pleurodeles waltl]
MEVAVYSDTSRVRCGVLPQQCGFRVHRLLSLRLGVEKINKHSSSGKRPPPLFTNKHDHQAGSQSVDGTCMFTKAMFSEGKTLGVHRQHMQHTILRTETDILPVYIDKTSSLARMMPL